MPHAIWYDFILFNLWFDLMWFDFNFLVHLSSFEIWGHKNQDINKTHTLIIRLNCPRDFMMQPQWSLASLFCLKDAFRHIFFVQCVVIRALAPCERQEMCSSDIEGVHFHGVYYTVLSCLTSNRQLITPSAPRLSAFLRHPDLYHYWPAEPAAEGLWLRSEVGHITKLSRVKEAALSRLIGNRCLCLCRRLTPFVCCCAVRNKRGNFLCYYVFIIVILWHIIPFCFLSLGAPWTSHHTTPPIDWVSSLS